MTRKVVGNVELDARSHPDGHWAYIVHDGKNYKRLASGLDDNIFQVDPIKLRSTAPKIADALIKAIDGFDIPFDARQKTTWFRDLPLDRTKKDKLDGIVWIKGRALFPDDDAEVLWDRFREVSAAVNKILLTKKIIGPLTKKP